MLNKPISEYTADEHVEMFPVLDPLFEEVVGACNDLRFWSDQFWYKLTGHIRIYDAVDRIPRHSKLNLLTELRYVGLISRIDVQRLKRLKDCEVASEIKSKVAEYMKISAMYRERVGQLDAHPVLPVVTKERCRIDADAVEMFRIIVEEHIYGMQTHGFASSKKPTWEECYNWAAEKKDSDGRPCFCKSLGGPFWTAAGIKRYFQAWCRHFGFRPKDITRTNRPDVKAVLEMRGLPSDEIKPWDLEMKFLEQRK